MLFDPKPCPNRAQNERAPEGPIVSGDTLTVTQSHRSELNRRPLLSLKVAFRGISWQLNDLAGRITAFVGREVGKSRPETVPKPCLGRIIFTDPHTNPLLRYRFSPQGEQDLEQAIRQELRTFEFRRHY